MKLYKTEQRAARRVPMMGNRWRERPIPRGKRKLGTGIPPSRRSSRLALPSAQPLKAFRRIPERSLKSKTRVSGLKNS